MRGTLIVNGLNFATLHLSGKGASLMKRLEILAIGVQSVFQPSLRNLPARLSTPVALLLFTRSLAKFAKCFLKVFAIVLGENVNSPFCLVNPFFLIIFQSSFGFPIFSDSFSCKSFHFLALIKACTIFLASL